ncbi:MAG: MBL fold metallo-hydrolase [Geminicoccales bacterium]
MMNVTLRIIGCGDAFCSGGRYHTCFQLDFREQVVLLDLGSTAFMPLRQASSCLDLIDQILISHLHGDHFGGLPFFLLNAQFIAKRRRPLTIAGPQGIQKRIEDTIAILFSNMGTIDWRFPLSFVELEPGDERILGAIKVKSYEVDHPDTSPCLALRLELEDKVLAFSGDTGWTKTLIDVADGADLFICECHSYEPNLFSHLDWQTLNTHQTSLRAKRILLTHMSQPMLDRVPSLDQERFEFANDGLVVTF